MYSYAIQYRDITFPADHFVEAESGIAFTK